MTGENFGDGGSRMSQEVTVVYPPNLQPADWQRAHENGDAPGAVPYGLDRLADHRVEVSYDIGRPAGRDPRTWAGIARLSRLRRNPERQAGQAAIAWDERMAVPLLARYATSRRRLGAGVIWATDELAAGELGVRSRPLRRTLQQMDLIWCLSRGQLPLLRSWLDVDPDRIAFVPFAVDTDFFAQRPWPDRPMVLSLGNDKDRDTTTLFAALELVHHAQPDARIVVQTKSVITPPPGVEVIESISTPELINLYSEATVVTVATRPNLHVSGMTVCLEAMATGRPVVLSRTHGASDYVIDSATGFLVQPGDADEHARAIVSILDDPILARHLGQSARKHVEAHHSQTVMCRHLAEHLFRESGT